MVLSLVSRKRPSEGMNDGGSRDRGLSQKKSPKNKTMDLEPAKQMAGRVSYVINL